VERILGPRRECIAWSTAQSQAPIAVKSEGRLAGIARGPNTDGALTAGDFRRLELMNLSKAYLLSKS